MSDSIKGNHDVGAIRRERGAPAQGVKECRHPYENGTADRRYYPAKVAEVASCAYAKYPCLQIPSVSHLCRRLRHLDKHFPGGLFAS